MKITIESTDLITKIDGVEVRVWEGVTEGGVPCKVFVRRVAVREDRDCEQFEAELKETAAPPENPPHSHVVPLHLIL